MTSRDGLYLRVSTGQQALLGDSLDVQLTKLRAYSQATDGEVVGIFKDAGRSAGSTKRPEYQRMMEEVRAGKLDRIIVTKLDRISRNLRDLLELVDDLKRYGVGLVIVTMQVDTTTANGQLFLKIVGAMAEWERQLNSERVLDIASQRAIEGKRNGGTIPYGYSVTWESETVAASGRRKRHGVKLILDPTEAPIVREMYERIAKGEPIGAVAHDLNARGLLTRNGTHWTTDKIQWLIANPVYRGDTAWGRRGKLYQEEAWTQVRGTHEGIVSEDLFARALRVPKARKTRPSASLFAGLLRCGRCGGGMTFTLSKNHKYYRCARRNGAGVAACEGVTIREDLIVQHVTDWLQTRRVESPVAEDTRPQIAGLRDELTANTEALERLTRQMVAGTVPESLYARLAQELSEQRETIEEQIAGLQAGGSGAPELDEGMRQALLARVSEVLNDQGEAIEDRREGLMMVVRRIQINPDRTVAIQHR